MVTIGSVKMIGKIISHYKILDKIGEGGMGVVYLAEDTKLDRKVALKFLPQQFSINEEEKSRFIQEAKAAAALDHPNICAVHEIDETKDGQMFIVMGYYEGVTLKDRIKKGPLKIEEALKIAIQVSEGLHEAHEKGIVHRDIKSANIIITDKGIAKILDFGLAKLKGQSKLTKVGTTVGTAAYMSPEQAKGQDVDHRTDIWSLGVVLYEMVTGQLPFKGDYEQAIMYAIMNEEPESVTGLRTGVPVELERIISKALEKQPKERYQGTADLLVDLMKLRKDFNPETILKKEKGSGITKKTSRKFLIGATFIMIAIIAAVLIILKPFFNGEVLPRGKIGIAVVHFENHSGDKALDHLKLGIPNLLITSLEQSKYFNVLTWERIQDLLKQMGKEKVEFVDKNLGFELCRREGIRTIVVGSYIKLGDTFATDVKVIDVETKKLILGASSKGNGEQSIIDNQIDELSKQISKASGLSEFKIKETIRPVREVTTTSMEAYNYFIRGREEREKILYQDSRKYLNKAIQLDPTFAMAYYYLGNKEAIKKAMEFSKNATRKERLFIESQYAGLIELDIEKKLHLLKQITKEYPAEKRAYFWIGLHYQYLESNNKAIQFLESNNKAIQYFEKALKIDPNWGFALNAYGYSLAVTSNFDKALEIIDRYIEVSPGDPNPIDTLGEIYFIIGRLDDAKAKFKEVREIKPNFYEQRTDSITSSWIKIGYIEALKENYLQAMEWIEKDINFDQSHGERNLTVGLWKGFYQYWQGRLNQSVNELENLKDFLKTAGRINAIGSIEYLKGWMYYEKEDFNKSKESFKLWLDYRKKTAPRKDPKYITEHSFFLGLIDLKVGRLNSAKSKLEKMKFYLPGIKIAFEYNAFYNGFKDRQVFYYHLLKAEILLVENNFEEAINVFKNTSLPQLSGEIGVYQYFSYNIPLQDVLARAYVKKGDLNQAITEYERLTTFKPASKDRRLIHPRYHYRLGKLYQKKGIKDKAIVSFNKFIKFWKDCDPIFQPLIEDARKRVRVLEGEK